jgi:DNA topoisomerase-3
VAFATSLAVWKGLKLPRGLKSNSAICRAFLDQHAPPRPPGSGELTHQSGARPPSEAMVRYARALAEKKGIECPSAVTTDFESCRAFLDEHSEKAQRPKIKNRIRTRGGTSTPRGHIPNSPPSNGSDSRKRVFTRKPAEKTESAIHRWTRSQPTQR